MSGRKNGSEKWRATVDATYFITSLASPLTIDSRCCIVLLAWAASITFIHIARIFLLSHPLSPCICSLFSSPSPSQCPSPSRSLSWRYSRRAVAEIWERHRRTDSLCAALVYFPSNKKMAEGKCEKVDTSESNYFSIAAAPAPAWPIRIKRWEGAGDALEQLSHQRRHRHDSMTIDDWVEDASFWFYLFFAALAQVWPSHRAYLLDFCRLESHQHIFQTKNLCLARIIF